MVPTFPQPKLTDHPLLQAAAPVCKAIAEVTRREPLARRSDLRERLRRTMASAVACIRAAGRHPEAEVASAHLAGAERLVQSVLEDLCLAYQDGFLSDDEYTEIFGGCASLCRQLRVMREGVPTGCHDSVAVAG